MAIDSHFYDTLPGKGINEVEWAQSAQSRGPVYGVTDPYELLLTPHPSTPYAVNISPAPKGFWGHGVWDTSDAVETVLFAPPAPGIRRFDMVMGRRDWTPTGGGPTVIMAMQGSATKAIPSARKNTPGEVDDQPLWLVEWLGGETQPQSVTDLRCFSGPGGVMANDRLALTYLKAPGARVQIGPTPWTYQLIRNREWDWVSPVTVYSPLTPVDYATDGRVIVENVAGGLKQVTLDFNIIRTGPDFPIQASYSGFGAVIPAQARGKAPVKYLAVSLSGGTKGTNGLANIAVNPETGQISVRAVQPFNWYAGALLSVNCSYYI